ncbi:TylF/MycF/NovP-related O-methyltransferase [Novosphingobium sp. PhB55]|uniref:TylF/MycF/NovP-related O-methyltransferase n=1 Tax=Novosphingobium sp. PhB55 TaxID=2485106 RepID=UPI0014170531|nr:TylF/MycF/NovP-related O-methyltransferase [Novosphingobium sp. PhB55]
MDNKSRFPIFNWAVRKLRPVGAIDALAGGRIAGWAAGGSDVQIEAWLGNKCVVRSNTSILRRDVANAHPRLAGAETSGFAFDLPREAVEGDFLGELRILARVGRSWRPRATLATMQIAGAEAARALKQAPASGITGPFPPLVIDAVASRWPEDCAALGTVAGQRRFADRLLRLLRTPDLNAIPVIADYARFLVMMLAHCRFVARHFPATNTKAAVGSADFHCKPNSIHELFTIIHQLYVLKASGVRGDFAEFGCFKGYSTAMLSQACALLGLRMHVFDSFEGLPPSLDSGYEAGQYAGSLDEVQDHVARFGALDAVTFHKGFFADSLRHFTPPPLLCLWMDVDLESSAEDLLSAIDRLDPRGTLFSHECTATMFQNGEIVASPAPDNPVPPVMMRSEALGRPLTGRYVAGYTGAFWPRAGGTPVVDAAVLMELAEALILR